MATSSTFVLIYTEEQSLSHALCMPPSQPDYLCKVGNKEILLLQLLNIEQGGFSSCLLCVPKDFAGLTSDWLSAVYSGGLQVTVHPTLPGRDTAGVLQDAKKTLEGCHSFFVAVGCTLFSPGVLPSLGDHHELSGAVVSMVAQKRSEVNTPGASSPFIDYVALSGHRVVFMRSTQTLATSISGGALRLKKRMLRQFPELRLRADLFVAEIYAMSPRVFEYLETSGVSSVHHHLLPNLAANHSGAPVSHAEGLSSSERVDNYGLCSALLLDEAVYCTRVDSVASYLLVNRHIREKTWEQVPEGVYTDTRASFWRGLNCDVDPQSTVGANCVLGKNTSIGRRCGTKRSTLGDHCKVSDMCKISNSILMDHVVMAEGVRVSDSVIGSNCILEEGTVIEGAIIGANVHTKQGEVIRKATVVASAEST